MLNPTTLATRHRAAAVAVGLVALLACIVGLPNGFAGDDAALLPVDARLHDLTGWDDLLAGPYWPPPYATDQYRPLTSLLLSVQHIAGSGSPTVFRVGSLALYAVTSVLLLRFARLLLAPMPALVAALLFAAHPVHVEAVAVAVNQAELLVAIFTLLGLHLYVQRRRSSNGPAARDWSVLAVIALLAALSKEQGLVFAGFLMLAELLVIQGRSMRVRVREVAGGFALIVAVAASVVIVRTIVLGEYAVSPNVAEALQTKTFAGRVVTMFRIAPEWLRLLLWPAHLRVDYSPQEMLASTAVGAREIAGFVLVAALAGLAFVARRRAPPLAFGLAFTGLAVLPVSNVLIPTGVLIAERTLFLPSVGAMLALAAAGDWLGRTKRVRAIPAIGYLWAGVVVALVVAGIWRSALRQRVWASNETLTLAAAEDSPRSWRTQSNYAELLFDRGDVAGGRAAFERAITLAGSPWWVRNAYARRLSGSGYHAAARAQLDTSLAEYPLQTDAVLDMVAVLIAEGRYAEARVLADRVAMVSGESPAIGRLRALADSAAAAGAPPGSVGVELRQQSPHLNPSP